MGVSVSAGMSPVATRDTTRQAITPCNASAANVMLAAMSLYCAGYLMRLNWRSNGCFKNKLLAREPLFALSAIAVR